MTEPSDRLGTICRLNMLFRCTSLQSTMVLQIKSSVLNRIVLIEQLYPLAVLVSHHAPDAFFGHAFSVYVSFANIAFCVHAFRASARAGAGWRRRRGDARGRSNLGPRQGALALHGSQPRRGSRHGASARNSRESLSTTFSSLLELYLLRG